LKNWKRKKRRRMKKTTNQRNCLMKEVKVKAVSQRLKENNHNWFVESLILVTVTAFLPFFL